MDSWGGEGGPNDHIIIYIPKTYFVKVTIKEGGGQNAQKKGSNKIHFELCID